MTQPIAAEEDTDQREDSAFPPALRPLLGAFLVLVVVAGTADLIMDRPATLASMHVLFEATMVVASLAFAVVLFRGWRRAAAQLSRTQASLAASRRSLAEQAADRDAWRARAEGALTSLAAAIDQQFDVWRLTRAERDVAVLLLQGFGHKQAAARLGRSERTVRQHAVEVYRKAGLQGRAELAAFFLRDLTLPAEGSAE